MDAEPRPKAAVPLHLVRPGTYARLFVCALLWSMAGAVAHAEDASTGSWVAAALLALVGLLSIWPLARRAVQRPKPAAPITPPAAPHTGAKRLTILRAQLEHLPVAAWAQVDNRLLPLSGRARRLVAPGGVRDKQALHTLLCSATASGPVVLETEPGSERWQLQRHPLALDGQQQTLLVLVPLQNGLETESLLAWQQLVQILAHEIMNSQTPIQSLSETALMLGDASEVEADSEQDLRTALDTIAQRAEGLSSFVGTTNHQVSP